VHYTSSMGMLELRQAIAEKLRRENGIEADPEKEILAVAGASHGMAITLMTVLEAREEIIIPNPCTFSTWTGPNTWGPERFPFLVRPIMGSRSAGNP